MLTASLASNIPIKTTNTYGIGSSTLGLSGAYFGSGDTDTTRLIGAASIAASYTFTLPTSGGTNLQYLMTNGSGVTSWDKTAATEAVSGFVTSYEPVIVSSVVSTATTPYTVASGVTMVVASHTSDQTIVLPAVASSAGRRIYIKKTGATGTTIINGNASETLDGYVMSGNGYFLSAQYAWLTVECDGTAWYVIDTGGDTKTDTANIDLPANPTYIASTQFVLSVGVWDIAGTLYMNNNITQIGARALWSTTASDNSPVNSGNPESANFGISSATEQGHIYVRFRYTRTTSGTIYFNATSLAAGNTGCKAYAFAVRVR